MPSNFQAAATVVGRREPVLAMHRGILGSDPMTGATRFACEQAELADGVLAMRYLAARTGEQPRLATLLGQLPESSLKGAAHGTIVLLQIFGPANYAERLPMPRAWSRTALRRRPTRRPRARARLPMPITAFAFLAALAVYMTWLGPEAIGEALLARAVLGVDAGTLLVLQAAPGVAAGVAWSTDFGKSRRVRNTYPKTPTAAPAAP